MDLAFYVHVNMKLIKIPTTIYVNATIKRWGHDFTRNKGRNIQTLEPYVKGKPHKAVNYLFLSYLPNHLFLGEIG